MSNYKFVFISIILAYYIAQLLALAFLPEAVFLRYFSIFQPIIFLVPVYYYTKENYITISNFNDLSPENTFQFVKEKLKLNFNFKPQIIIFLLWGMVGLLIANIGIEIIISFLMPESLVEFFNRSLDGVYATQNIITYNKTSTINEFLQICLFVSLIPAVCEEILFRGYLMQNLLVKNKAKYAVVVSAFLFSLIHANIVGFVPIFVIGLYLGILVLVTDSIFPSIVFHFLNNLFIIIGTNYGKNATSLILTSNIILGIVLFCLGVCLMIFTIKKMRSIK